MKKAVLLTCILLFVAVVAQAHGGGKVMGTVKAVRGGQVSIIATDGDRVSLKLTPDTKIFKGDDAGTRGDIKEGVRIVAHYRHDGTATEIRLPAEK